MTDEDKLKSIKSSLWIILESDDEDLESDDGDEKDFNPADRYGHNFDDAYEGGRSKGYDEGRKELA